MKFSERKTAVPQQLEDGILPMINVVFLLLIFFMLTGQLSALDPFEVAPPETISEGAPESSDLLVLVGRYGRVAIDGLDVPAESLAMVLSARLKAEPGMKIRVKADGRTEALQVVEIMRVVRDAGAKSLQLLALPGPG
jgi:biopolymer transport protein ExbD